MNTNMVGNKVNGKYFGEYDGEGTYFKDEEAYKNDRNAICYIAEAGFEDSSEEDWSITEEEARKAIKNGGVSTHNSLFAELKYYLLDEFGRRRIEDEFVERCCDYVFQECDWFCFSTFFTQTDFEEDLIEYIVEKATKREDWNSEWDTKCCYDYIKENLYNIHTDIDSLIDGFIDLPNY